jgi:hypothetical protein
MKKIIIALIIVGLTAATAMKTKQMVTVTLKLLKLLFQQKPMEN